MLVRDYDGCMRTIFHLLDRIPADVEVRCFSGSANSGVELATFQVPDLTIPFNNSYKMALPYLKPMAIKKLLDAYQPDIIHVSNPSFLGRYAINYAKKRGIPVTTIFHTNYVSYVDYYLRDAKALISMTKKFVEFNLRGFYQDCDLVLVPTQAMYDELERIRIDGYRMKIWRRGIDRSIFNPSKRKVAVLHQLTGNTKPNLLFASRLVWEKNLETLIRIQRENEKLGLPYNLLIAGHGVAKEKLQEELPSAFFLGNLNQEQLAQYYASADIFVFPSVSETYGNVVIESLSCGTPCVIADAGGSGTLIDQAITGYKVSPYDEQAYMSRIAKILDHGREMFSNSCVEATKDLDWNALASKYYGLLDSLRKEKGKLKAA